METIAAKDRFPFGVALSIVCSGMKMSSVSTVSSIFPGVGFLSCTVFTSGEVTSFKKPWVFDSHSFKVSFTAAVQQKHVSHKPG